MKPKVTRNAEGRYSALYRGALFGMQKTSKRRWIACGCGELIEAKSKAEIISKLVTLVDEIAGLRE